MAGLKPPQWPFSEAAQWYGKAVEKSGYPTDRYELGLLYERGLGVTQDREKAMELYFAAAAYSEKARSRVFSPYEANLDLPSDPHGHRPTNRTSPAMCYQ